MCHFMIDDCIQLSSFGAGVRVLGACYYSCATAQDMHFEWLTGKSGDDTAVFGRNPAIVIFQAHNRILFHIHGDLQQTHSLANCFPDGT